MRVAAFGIAACGFFLAGAAVVVACYVAAHRYSAGSAAPRAQSGDHVGNQAELVASSHTINFGIVPQGAVRSEIFSLTNTGRAPVVIKRVRTSCDCAVVKVARSAIQPNETALASAAIDLGRAGGADDFTGGLSIEVVGIDSTGADAVAIELRVEVMASAEFEQAIRDDKGKPLLAFELRRAP